jgi:hypothetical protein
MLLETSETLSYICTGLLCISRPNSKLYQSPYPAVATVVQRELLLEGRQEAKHPYNFAHAKDTVGRIPQKYHPVFSYFHGFASRLRSVLEHRILFDSLS